MNRKTAKGVSVITIIVGVIVVLGSCILILYMTIEKYNSLVDEQLEQDRQDSLFLVERDKEISRRCGEARPEVSKDKEIVYTKIPTTAPVLTCCWAWIVEDKANGNTVREVCSVAK